MTASTVLSQATSNLRQQRNQPEPSQRGNGWASFFTLFHPVHYLPHFALLSITDNLNLAALTITVLFLWLVSEGGETAAHCPTATFAATRVLVLSALTSGAQVGMYRGDATTAVTTASPNHDKLSHIIPPRKVHVLNQSRERGLLSR
jgi:hypothetical protein